MELDRQAGLESPDRGGITWQERAGAVQAYYTRARQEGECRRCGKKGYLRIGVHPLGWVGQPPKVCGTDLTMLKDWIERAGWVCPGCALRSGRRSDPPVVGVVVVEKKSWEPYPVEWTKWREELDRQLLVMESGSDGMGVRSKGDCMKYEANYLTGLRKVKGWMTPEEWFDRHEKFVPAP